jgi:hypothetical protein
MWRLAVVAVLLIEPIDVASAQDKPTMSDSSRVHGVFLHAPGVCEKRCDPANTDAPAMCLSDCRREPAEPGEIRDFSREKEKQQSK